MIHTLSTITVNLNPIILDLGPLKVTWYGLLYVVGFLVGMQVLRYLFGKGFAQVPVSAIDTLVLYLIVGMFLGARLTYVFIYDWAHFKDNLWEIAYTWHGGMSFHGALLGFVAASVLFARKFRRPVLEIMDCVAIAACPGLFFGRIGNFINGELYGRVTDVSWAMIFPMGGLQPRHPSQLYEAFGEGLLLFGILWFVHSRTKVKGVLASGFLIGYGLVRYVVEFFREADVQLGYYLGGTTTMGQMLCLTMVLAGALLLLLSRKHHRSHNKSKNPPGMQDGIHA